MSTGKVEVVRCQHCRYGSEIVTGLQKGAYKCEMTDGYLWMKDDFCSYGERKEAECDGKVQTETV